MLSGAGVLGAVGAISFSVFAAFLLPAGDRELRHSPSLYRPGSYLEGIQAIIFFIGQVIISNVDILMVKHYFAPSGGNLCCSRARRTAVVLRHLVGNQRHVPHFRGQRRRE